MTSRSRSASRGFTIIEMLVVIIIIGILLGLIAPALSGVKKRGHKTREQSNLRQIHVAWLLYAKTFDDAAMPGFIDEDVQDAWRIRAKLPDNTQVPPDALGQYPWRLVEYLDGRIDLLNWYLDLDDPLFDYGNARDYATTPAFGYNALYVGGWWEMANMGGNDVPRYRFFNARSDRDGDGSIDANERTNVVARSVGELRHDVIIFSAAAARQPGFYKYKKANNRTFPGSHFVVPPIVADEVNWQLTSSPLANAGTPFGGAPGLFAFQQQQRSGGLNDIDVLVDTSVPYARYNDQVSFVTSDGSTKGESFAPLVDQRRWINAATNVRWTHTED